MVESLYVAECPCRGGGGGGEASPAAKYHHRQSAADRRQESTYDPCLGAGGRTGGGQRCNIACTWRIAEHQDWSITYSYTRGVRVDYKRHRSIR